MDGFISEFGLFLAKAITIVLALALLGLLLRRRHSASAGHIQVTDINRQLETAGDSIAAVRLAKPQRKRLLKQRRAARKDRQHESDAAVVYLLDFKGDIRASAVASLREEISAILQAAKPGDAVLLRLESAGGTVNRYGLAAAQLLRLRSAGLPLTVTVDSIAASGGYLMAATADRIVASPFALVGSIGVIAQIPNFHRWLQARDIDWEQFTAGRYKRTVTLFGENTEEGRAKLREELEDIHAQFRSFVHTRRAGLDLDRVSTGEAWLGSKALELGLVDELATSDDLILAACRKGTVLHVCYRRKLTLQERLQKGAQTAWDGVWNATSPYG